MLPGLLPILTGCGVTFNPNRTKKSYFIYRISMSTIAGLVRLFSRRTTKLLSSRIVSNNVVGSCRSRSVFAATMARGASQNPRLLISCACSKVCVCEVHKYTQGWYQNSVYGMFALLRGHRDKSYCSKHDKMM